LQTSDKVLTFASRFGRKGKGEGDLLRMILKGCEIGMVVSFGFGFGWF
jgi:hypothetical protein